MNTHTQSELLYVGIVYIFKMSEKVPYGSYQDNGQYESYDDYVNVGSSFDEDPALFPSIVGQEYPEQTFSMQLEDLGGCYLSPLRLS